MLLYGLRSSDELRWPGVVLLKDDEDTGVTGVEDEDPLTLATAKEEPFFKSGSNCDDGA